MDIRAELRNKRMEFLKEIDRAASPIEFYDVQKNIILEIIDSEKKYFNGREEAYRDHVLVLRNYGDTIPWLILNQKSISKIYNRNTSLYFLNNNVEKIMQVLEQGKDYATLGHLIILGASTNLFFGTDIVVCDDKKEPICLNFSKPNDEEEKVINFQALKIRKDFAEGRNRKKLIKKCGFSADDRVISDNWEKIDASIEKAMTLEEGYCSIEDGNFIWAFKYNGDMPDMNEEISKVIKGYNRPMVGCHFTILDEPELMIPPPSCWPIKLSSRMALMEGDIALMHYIDLEILKSIEKADGYIKDILYEGSKLKEECIVVSSRQREKTYSAKYINDILYGYCEIWDIANQLIDNMCI
ncbi:hypothetical protein IAI10_00155 [Clostridium sp. 19966]|uniref:hypothetical protein n=1 Tax=Clostridium sp. 19966 TaxID=2768166 RepID=UPI0028E0291E|nr:hypothetical protein [Clostridium sp. 19966]MDT8715091.1 hypothetical protein [Clostridium sp. 19966]